VLLQDRKPGLDLIERNVHVQTCYLAQWSTFAPKVTGSFDIPTAIPTRLDNADPPLTSFMLAFFIVVSKLVLADLVGAEGCASIRFGQTPMWHQKLPSPVMSYIKSINKATKTGGNDRT
jgi:hypothetical protein